MTRQATFFVNDGTRPVVLLNAQIARLYNLVITFANSLKPEQAQRNHDLGPTDLTL